MEDVLVQEEKELIQQLYAFGGQAIPPAVAFARVAFTESWNGTSWTEVNDLNIIRSNSRWSWNSILQLLAFGGLTTGATLSGATEEWDVATRGAWATGNPLNTARSGSMQEVQVHKQQL
jgi:hypothetical protein